MDKVLPELLAPAGDMSSLKAAVAHGANAVYLGLSEFSARAKAENFTLQSLSDAVNYAHLFGVKVYLAMNTLIKDSEMRTALSQAEKAWSMGVDAIIVQDIGFICQLNRTMPSIVLHASTQMGIHNAYGAAIVQDLGVKRAILARETLLCDMKEIKAQTDLELEFFVQGAMCVSFSGNCYLSSCVSGYSGNRGRCMQLCRKKYRSGQNEGYLLSPKDLCLAGRLKELADAGISSFKIEGRMRRPEYVAAACSVYSSALKSFDFSEKDMRALKLAFNRGDYCAAHLDSPNEDIIFPSMQGHLGLCVGRVDRICGGTAFFGGGLRLKKGDGVKFLRGALEVGSALVTNEDCTTFAGSVQAGDKINLTSSAEFAKGLLQKEARIPLCLSAEFTPGDLARITARGEGFCVSAQGETVQAALNAPLKKEKLAESLSRLGGTNFSLQRLDIAQGGDVFMPVSALNGLKRSAVKAAEQAILDAYKRKENDISCTMPGISAVKFMELKQKALFCAVDAPEAVTENMLQKSDYIVLVPPCFEQKVLVRFAELCKEKAVLSLPNVARGADMLVLKEAVQSSGIQSFVANNLYSLKLAEGKTVIWGFEANRLNGYAQGHARCVSAEADILSDEAGLVYYALGYLPLMTLCHCPKKNFSDGCKACKGYDYEYTDETKNKFYIKRQKISACYGKLKNGKLTCLCSEAAAFKNAGVYLDFTSPFHKDIDAALNSFLNGTMRGETKGNLSRGLK